MKKMTVEIQQLIEKQNSIRQDFISNNAFDIETLNYIAGVDLAYWEKGGVEVAVCCIVVLDYKTHEVIEEVNAIGEIHFPYLPGFLAFREVPLILETNKKLTIEPDIYMFDGTGYLHPRHMGAATHAGILINKPSIGVAKSYYRIENTDFEMPEEKLFSYTDIIIHGDVYGRAFRSHKNGKPIFLSVGNMIDLDTATSVVEGMIMKESRIPLPVLLADAETRKMRKVYSG